MPQINLPMINIADYCFNVGCLIAIDLTRYDVSNPDPNNPAYAKRAITLTLVGPTIHTFKGARADDAFDWYLNLTGQKTAELIAYPDRPGSH